MKKFLLGIILLSFLLTGVVFAEDPYTFTLTEGAKITEEENHYYADLSAPAVSGMADAEEQAQLNAYFLDYLDSVYAAYTEDKAYAEENWQGDDMPRFGYEYFWQTVCENENYFVFKTATFYAAGSSMTANEYWTLDKHSGKLVKLEDLIDAERHEQIRDLILAEMNAKTEEGMAFWTEDDIFSAAFGFVDDYHHWYVNEAGNLVITFDKYEIAPGAYGEIVFEITEDKATLISDESNVFSLYVHDTFSDDQENWFIHLTVPEVHGLADSEEEDLLNQHFVDYAEGLHADYDDMVSSAEESVAEGMEPHFSFEYDYSIMLDNDDLFVFKTEYVYVAASFSSRAEYWNLDKNTRALLKLSDVTGEGAMTLIHDSIYEQMKAANESGEGMYYIDDEADTLSLLLDMVDVLHHWYLTGDGNVVITFDKYDIAPGAMGGSEFTFSLEDLK